MAMAADYPEANLVSTPLLSIGNIWKCSQEYETKLKFMIEVYDYYVVSMVMTDNLQLVPETWLGIWEHAKNKVN